MSKNQPCLSGCYLKESAATLGVWVPVHDPNCPNAPKPAEPPAKMECGECGDPWPCSVATGETTGDALVVRHHPSQPPAPKCKHAPASDRICQHCPPVEPQSEPPLKWNSEGLAEAPGMRYCTMYGSMFLYIDGKSQGVLISTASDEASRRKAAEEDFRSRMVPPQSEPPIDWVAADRLAKQHQNDPYLFRLVLGYEALKAERDGLFKSLQESLEWRIKNGEAAKALGDENAALKAKVDRLVSRGIEDLRHENAALKARVEGLEADIQSLHAHEESKEHWPL